MYSDFTKAIATTIDIENNSIANIQASLIEILPAASSLNDRVECFLYSDKSQMSLKK